MKLEEAIKLLHKYRHIDDDLCIEDVNAALELGIEAIKAWKALRDNPGMSFDALLPGETRDYCKFCGLAHADIECPSRAGER